MNPAINEKGLSQSCLAIWQNGERPLFLGFFRLLLPGIWIRFVSKLEFTFHGTSEKLQAADGGKTSVSLYVTL